MCSVQRWNQFQNYLIKTIETVFISLAIYITNNWISYGEWNECRYMYIEACMWQSPSMTNSKWQGRWSLKSPPLSPNHFKLLILCKNFVCVKSKIIIFFFIQINTCHWCIFLTLKHNIMTSIRNSPVFEVNVCIQE